MITRLDETCREVRDAARVIGDAELFKKMEDAQIKIKRDSQSSSSLRVTKADWPCYSCIRRKPVFLGPRINTSARSGSLNNDCVYYPSLCDFFDRFLA